MALSHLFGVCARINMWVLCVRVCWHLADAASKHAAQAFFDCLRAEVEEYGIIVSTISHTFINVSDPPPVKEPEPKPNTLSACEFVKY